MIVLSPVAERLSKLLKKYGSSFVTGSGVSDRIINSSLEKLQDAKQKGAGFLIGGPEKASHSALKPTIITRVTKDMQLSDEEAFGPSFSLYVVNTDQEAIDLANETRYGLNAAVHSTSMDHALSVAREIDTAQVHVNSMTAHDERRLTSTCQVLPVDANQSQLLYRLEV